MPSYDECVSAHMLLLKWGRRFQRLRSKADKLAARQCEVLALKDKLMAQKANLKKEILSGTFPATSLSEFERVIYEIRDSDHETYALECEAQKANKDFEVAKETLEEVEREIARLRS